MRTTTTFKLKDSTIESLKRLKVEEDRTMSQIIDDLVEQYIKTKESMKDGFQ